MLSQSLLAQLNRQLSELQTQGLYKTEQALLTPQASQVAISQHAKLINLCANNYLGLANDPQVIAAAHQALDQFGYGMASVRFICGTQTIHRQLEQALSDFLGMEDCILYSSCFDANGGLFETLMNEQDTIISDSLNHASIIDGIRLSKAKRLRYANNDMQALEDCLKQARQQHSNNILIVTDGVFSMDGTIANLPTICDLAEQYQALVMVDDSHAVGVLGEHGKGTMEHCQVMGRVDIISGTLGKALGGASGGYICAAQPIIDWLRQRSRPYLFSNSLAPVIVATSLSILKLLQQRSGLRHQLQQNADYFRARMTELGFELILGQHPIIPIMVHDANLAQRMANALLEEGVLVVGFSYPVVPMGEARIRTQMSAVLTPVELDHAIAAFYKVGRQLNML
ncbi:2-amino-3-ketobutyrate coenzyme A ligase [Marinomonas aquimarina]|uniref:2-amino-3-ketobutyrate coenzyme A ligase n=1 Tax=Marinomonas aquimarina TaxID=295068 RepID=A0A1A8TLQ8_9GAMM|nr:glycine C-acetyltransferase [Marinomonas aquimarina]SBS34002.1 2-amino-3-ketobutyrate coenzyme A ligase [Marinomonas aquimarina]